ncbi:MAG: hypothetical protein MI749_01840 [Desulfovibrionales bacterium]|nr:hypothetical protein [Desulfovibrionales bacterium]
MGGDDWFYWKSSNWAISNDNKWLGLFFLGWGELNPSFDHGGDLPMGCKNALDDLGIGHIKLKILVESAEFKGVKQNIPKSWILF